MINIPLQLGALYKINQQKAWWVSVEKISCPCLQTRWAKWCIWSPPASLHSFRLQRMCSWLQRGNLVPAIPGWLVTLDSALGRLQPGKDRGCGRLPLSARCLGSFVPTEACPGRKAHRTLPRMLQKLLLSLAHWEISLASRPATIHLKTTYACLVLL